MGKSDGPTLDKDKKAFYSAEGSPKYSFEIPQEWENVQKLKHRSDLLRSLSHTLFVDYFKSEKRVYQFV